MGFLAVYWNHPSIPQEMLDETWIEYKRELLGLFLNCNSISQQVSERPGTRMESYTREELGTLLENLTNFL